MRSFYVPPKYSAPLTRGFFLRRATSCVESVWGEVFDTVTDCVAANGRDVPEPSFSPNGTLWNVDASVTLA
jgi:hypothetical protein